MMNERNPLLKAGVSALIIGILWSFGNGARALAAFILIVALISTPVSGGSSALAGMIKGLNSFLWGKHNE